MNAKMRYQIMVTAICLVPQLNSTLATAAEPRQGDVQTRQVITISLAVSNAGKETKRVVYSPPPGWYIRSHSISCTKKQGLASFAVTTVPAHWVSSSEEAKSDSAKATGDAELDVNVVKGVKGKLAGTKDSTAAEKKNEAFSHHALVVDAIAQGGGFWRSGAAIEMTVSAEMVYMGKD